jgi:hypothetical protein
MRASLAGHPHLHEGLGTIVARLRCLRTNQNEEKMKIK